MRNLLGRQHQEARCEDERLKTRKEFKLDYFKSRVVTQQFQEGTGRYFAIDGFGARGRIDYDNCQLFKDMENKIDATLYEVKLYEKNSRNKRAEGMRYIYRLGGESLTKRDPEKLLKYMAIGIAYGIPTWEMEASLFSNSNCCMYSLWGCCIMPECLRAHEVKFEGLLEKYYA